MELTKDQLQAAARRLCEVRGIDPDHFPGGWDNNKTLASREIEAFIELQDAIAFGIAVKPASPTP